MTDMKKTARQFMLMQVLKVVRTDWDKLNKINNQVDKNIKRDLKQDELTLDWILSEVLDYHYLLKLIVEKGFTKDDKYETIYRFNGRRFIRRINMGLTQPNTYEYVKRYRKRVTVYEYLPVLENQNL